MRSSSSLSVALCFSLLAGAAHAQDDWSLTREPARTHTGPASGHPAARKPRPQAEHPPPTGAEQSGTDLRERYVKALLARPDDAFALDRLRELSLAQSGSLEELVARFARETQQAPADMTAREAYVRVLSLSGHPDRALSELEAALAASGPSAHERLSLLRGELLRGLGRGADARAVYEGLTSKTSRETRKTALRALGELALAGGDLAAAAGHFRALAGDAHAPELRAEWPRALSASGHHREAAKAYLELAGQSAGDVRAAAPFLREAAREALAAGDLAEARGTLERAVASAGEGGRAELYDLLVEAHRRAGTLNELAERMSRDGRSRPELMLRAAMLWDELGHEEQAVSGYRAWLSRSARDIDTRARLARLLARSGRLDELAREYETLVNLAPDEPSFLVALAELMRERGERDEALRLLARGSARAPRSLAMHRALAQLYTSWGAREQAEHELSLLARLDPDDASHVIALGEEAFERADKPAAMRIWQRLLEGGGDRAEAHATLASVLGDHGLLEQAIEEAGKAIELAPERLDFRRSMASLLERAGKSSDAETTWHWVMEHAGNDAAVRREARQHLVGIWLRSGLAARRAQDLDARFRAQPPDLEAGRLLAELYARDPSRADSETALLEQIVKLDPRDVESLRALERAYTRRGAMDRAQATLDRLIQADPGSAGAYLARAVELALSRYRDDEALHYAERAVEIRPQDGKARRLLGDLFRRRQDLDRAVAAYEKAAELDQHDHDTRLLLAQIETARGHDDAAHRWLLEVIQGSPDDDLVGRAARAAMQLALPEATRDRLELTLLELCLSRPERPLYRRLLVESYARRLGPLAERVQRGVATEAERGRVERVGNSSIKPLLEALADTDPMQRSTALDLLGAARVRHAGGPLMTLAEQGDNVSERARALSAIGLIGDPALGARLRKLVARNERRLLPIALWALAQSEGANAADTLLARLRDEQDASVRVMCALALGALGAHQATSLLESLAHERHAAMRAAALWSLARLDRDGHRGLFVEALSAPAPASLVALFALPDDFDVLVRALSSELPTQRALGVRMLMAPAAASSTLPVPSLPFVARSYVASLLEVDDRALDTSRLRERWPQLSAAFERSLRADVPERIGTLDALRPYAGGLVPLALLERGLCPGRDLARSLATGLRDALGALTSDPTFAGRDAALSLLAASGADHPQVALALGSADVRVRLRLLDALAQAESLSPNLRKQLLRVFDQAPDWPTRMRIAHVLGDAVGKERLASEKVALVRAAAAHPASRETALTCSQRTIN